jgi:hypothetical protein
VKTLRALNQLIRANILERVRRDSFFIVLAIAVFAGYMFVPPFGSAYTSLVISSHRGYFNSPWVGTLYGVVSSTLLSLIGFYLVKNAVSYDYRTKVGQVIATTPIPKPTYLLGKWVSNVAILALILAVLTIMAPIMQLVRGENSVINMWDLAAPIWFMGLPSLSVVSAIAVLFESIPLLRGGFGNVVYFFVWGPGIMASEGALLVLDSNISPFNDFGGLSVSMFSIREQLIGSGVENYYGVSGVIGPVAGEEIVRFVWNGIDWTAGIFLERLVWIGIAIVIALVASIPFDRFDPARKRVSGFPRIKLSGGMKQLAQRGQALIEQLTQVLRKQNIDLPDGDSANIGMQLTPVQYRSAQNRWMAVFLAEMRLMLKGQKWLWYVGAIGLFIASLSSPLDVAHHYLLLATWLWPILLWSRMGNRERRHQTYQIVFSVAHPLRRQLVSNWMAGLVIALITGGGVAIQLIAAGSWHAFLAWISGAIFIPSLALALGVWSGGGRLFEITYVLLWYLGPVNRIQVLDFMGIASEFNTFVIPIIYLVISILLIGTAMIGRQRQLQI